MSFDNFEESLKKLDLQGLVLVIGLLSQRALEVMAEQQKPTAKNKIIKVQP